MSLSRIFGSIAFLAVTVLLAAGLYLQFADLSRYRDTIETQVSKLTGRAFHIGGNIEMKLLPAPSLLLEQLSLANPEWSETPTMATVGLASVRVGLWSLLSGPIQIEDLQLSDVEVLLETDATGRSNLDFAAADTNTEAAPSAPDEEQAETQSDTAEEFTLPLMVQQAHFSNLRLTRRQADLDDQVISIEEIALRPQDSQVLALSATGDLLGHPLQLAGSIEPRTALRTLGSVQFKFDGSLGALALDIDGTMADVEHLSGTQLKAMLSAEDVADLAAMAELSLALEGPLHLSTDVTQKPGGLDMQLQGEVATISSQASIDVDQDNISIDAKAQPLSHIGTALGVADLPEQPLQLSSQLVLGEQATEIKQLTAQINGATIDIQGQLASGEASSHLDVKASGSSLAEVITSLPAIPFTADAKVALSPEHFSADPFNLSFGDSDLSGSVKVAMTDTTSIDATIASKRLDLHPFESAEEPAEAPEEDNVDTAPKVEPEPKSNKESGQYVFTEEPLPYDDLDKFDADLQLTIGNLLSTTADLHDLRLDLNLHGGDLSTVLAFDSPAGGKSASRILLNTSEQPARLNALVQARDMRINIGSGDVDNLEQIPPTSVTVELESTGASARALASNANGRVLLTQGAGRVENGVLGRISGDIIAQLLSALNPLSKTQKYANWECSLIAVNITDGESRIEDLVLQAKKIMVVAGGKIDLNNEKINIEFNTKPREGVGISADMLFTPFITLQGTLAKPRVGLNEKGAALTAGAAFATGGISILVKGAADRATGEIDQCKRALPKYPQPPLTDIKIP